MQPSADNAPRLGEGGLTLVVNGRTYDGDVSAEHVGQVARMPVPKEMDALAEALTRQSRLLALAADSGQTEIYDAYGHDLKLLSGYRDAFRATVEAAIRARTASDETSAQAFLDRMTAQLSEVVHEPTLNLGPDALRLEPADLLRQLQRQFRADVESLKQGVAVWLHVLAESDYVSVIEWFGPKALRYHFFRVDAARREQGRKVEQSGNVFVGITTTTTVESAVQVTHERRVHTVVNAEAHDPSTYLRKVPERIARLMDAVPAEIRPFVTIIDGTVTEEEVHRRLVSKHVEVERRSVYTPDPALALFNTWAINGWGGSTPERAASVYRGHALVRANRILVAELVGTAALAALAFGLEGRRAGIVAGLVCLILVFFQQLGMRIDNRPR